MKKYSLKQLRNLIASGSAHDITTAELPENVQSFDKIGFAIGTTAYF